MRCGKCICGTVGPASAWWSVPSISPKNESKVGTDTFSFALHKCSPPAKSRRPHLSDKVSLTWTLSREQRITHEHPPDRSNRPTQKPFPKSLSESTTAPRSCLKQARPLNMTNGETVMKMRDSRTGEEVTGDDVPTKEIEDERKSHVR